MSATDPLYDLLEGPTHYVHTSPDNTLLNHKHTTNFVSKSFCQTALVFQGKESVDLTVLASQGLCRSNFYLVSLTNPEQSEQWEKVLYPVERGTIIRECQEPIAMLRYVVQILHQHKHQGAHMQQDAYMHNLVTFFLIITSFKDFQQVQKTFGELEPHRLCSTRPSMELHHTATVLLNWIVIILCLCLCVMSSSDQQIILIYLKRNYNNVVDLFEVACYTNMSLPNTFRFS